MALFSTIDLQRMDTRRFTLYESAEKVLARASESYRRSEQFDIFLSHSFKDADTVLRTRLLLESFGHKVYVDWVEDSKLDRSKVDKNTAALLRHRMESCKSLFYATSENSSESRWMPWELGYFDAFKGKVAIMPISNMQNKYSYKGEEYLGLYPYAENLGGKIGIADETPPPLPFNIWIHIPAR